MITDVQEKVRQFLEEALDVKEAGEFVRIIGIVKNDDGWVAQVEVVERSRMLPEYRVFEKLYYLVKLNSKMEIDAYKRVEVQKEQEEGYESNYEF